MIGTQETIGVLVRELANALTEAENLRAEVSAGRVIRERMYTDLTREVERLKREIEEARESGHEGCREKNRHLRWIIASVTSVLEADGGPGIPAVLSVLRAELEEEPES